MANNEMKIWLKVGLIVAVYQAVSSANIRPDSKPFLKCFDATTDSFEIGAESVPDLSENPYFFDNKATKCVVNGIYILYGNYHFNADDHNGVSCLFREVNA